MYERPFHLHLASAPLSIPIFTEKPPSRHCYRARVGDFVYRLRHDP